MDPFLWVWVTILLTWILTLVLHFVLRKPLVITYYVCPACTGLRRRKMALSGAAMAAGFVMFVAGFAFPDDLAVFPILGGIIIGVIGMIALLVFASPLLTPKGYDKASMTFSVRGAKPGGLERLSQHADTSSQATDGAVW